MICNMFFLVVWKLVFWIILCIYDWCYVVDFIYLSELNELIVKIIYYIFGRVSFFNKKNNGVFFILN